MKRRASRSPLLLLLLLAVVLVAASATIASAAADRAPGDLDAWLGDEDALTTTSPDSDDEVEAAAAALAARASGTPGAPPPPPPPQPPKSRAALADAKKRATAAAHKAAASPSKPLMRMRPHEATVWFYVLVGLVMTSLMVGFKESGAGWLLQGLMVLRIKTETTATATPGGDASSNKARKRAASNLQQQLQRQQQQQPDIWMEPIRPSLLAQLEFKDALDLVLLYTAVALGVAGAAWLVQRVGGMVPNSLPLITQACVVAYVLAELIKSELAHEAVSKNDRAGYLVAAVVGAASAGAVLVAIPPGRLTDFDADAGGYAAGLQLHETIERRMNGTAAAAGGKGAAAAPEGGLMLAEEGLPGVAAWAPCLMAAALISGGLMAPGMRYGRALMQALHPPQWARTFLGGPPSSWALAAVRLSFAAPLVVVALWFPPLTDALGLGRGFSETASVLAALDPHAQEHARLSAQLRALALVRGLAVTLAGALQLLAARPLAQAFLNTGLFAWYQLKYVGISNVDDARVAALTRRQVLGALALAAKCGLQMCAPAAVLLPCGALLLLRGVGEGDAFVAVAAGFVAWWTCLTWAFFGALSVLLARLGSQGGVVNVS